MKKDPRKGKAEDPIEVSDSEDEAKVVDGEKEGSARRSAGPGPSSGKGKERETEGGKGTTPPVEGSAGGGKSDK